MKKCILFCLGIAVATLAQAAGERAFVLAPAGEVDAALVERVRGQLEGNSGAAVRLAPAVPMEPGQTLETIGRTAAATLGADDFAVIVLAQSTVDQPQGVCLPDVRFAILNLARLAAGVDAAKWERRIGQEGLRVMSMLLDMSPCPFPLCVLVGYEKTEDLDQMSGNYCPPCQERFTRLAGEAGLRQIVPPAPALEETPEAPAEETPAIEEMPAAAEVPAAEAAAPAEPVPAAE
jgi:hypothetical protein